MRVLIADDERAFACAVSEMVRCAGHEVVEVVHCGLDAIRAYRRHRPEVVLMDYAMARLNGLTACRNILSEDPRGRILFLSGRSDRQELAPKSSGATAVLQKPIDFALLQQALQEMARPVAADWSANEETTLLCASAR